MALSRSSRSVDPPATGKRQEACAARYRSVVQRLRKREGSAWYVSQQSKATLVRLLLLDHRLGHPHHICC